MEIELLQRGHAFAPRQNRGFFQIQVALQPAPRFVGDLALAQQFVKEIALGLDQLLAQIVAFAHGFESAVQIVGNRPLAVIVTRVEELEDLRAQIPLAGDFFQMMPRRADRRVACRKLGLLLAAVLGFSVRAKVVCASSSS